MPASTITPEAVEKMIADTLPQFGVDPSDISSDATFEDLDVDSLDLAELSQIVEEEYGVRLDADDIRTIKTVGGAVDLVVSRAG
jgi:acyl carrier protein